MASTNKTPQLGLNQWAAGDEVMRTDFNADNAKIEAAVGAVGSANCMVKLMDITTTAAAQQVDLDISKIQWERYTEVIIYATFGSTPSCGMGGIRFNNYAGTNAYSHSVYSKFSTSNRAAYLCTYDDTRKAGNRYTIQCMSGDHTLFAENIDGSGGYHSIGANITDGLRALPLQKTMNFLPQQDQTLTAGGKILVYGVLR